MRIWKKPQRVAFTAKDKGISVSFQNFKDTEYHKSAWVLQSE